MTGCDGLTITVYDHLADAENVWKTFEREGEHYAFQTYRWVSCWHATVGVHTGIRARVILVEHAQRGPLFLLPLGLQAGSFGSTLIWLGGALADYCAPLLGPGFGDWLDTAQFRRIWRAVLDELGPVDAVCLERQPEAIGPFRNLFLDLGCVPHPSRAHFTRLTGTLDDFVRDKRSARWASGERRKERHLAKHGDVEFVLARDAQAAAELVPVMIRQKSRSYGELGVRDLFASPGYADFVQALSASGVQDSFVYLCALKVGDRVAATFWGLHYRQRLYYLLPTYERDELTRFSPGNVLLRRMFGWCLDHGVTVFDFTVGDEPYKRHWCDRELMLHDYFRGLTWRGSLYVAVVKTRQRLKRRIKETPWLWRAVQSLRARR